MKKKSVALFTSLVLCLCLLCTNALAAGLSLKDYGNGHDNFNSADKKIDVSIDVGSDGIYSGIIYVYASDGTAMSDSNPPLYADYVKTDSTGKADLSILLPEAMSCGTYKVDFYTAILTEALSDDFTYFTDAELLENKRYIIWSDLKGCTTYGGIAEVILGADSAGNVINDNFDVISSDAGADMTYYNAVSSKEGVFSKMVSGVSSIADYWAGIDLFVSASKKQYEEENIIIVPTDKDNTTLGNTTTVITDSKKPASGGSVGGGTVTVPPTQQPDVSIDNTGFDDMQGHWAEKFADELLERGIMKGYEDGSFRGENSITRAELAKTLVEAMDIGMAGGVSYIDIADGAWYSDYVAAAAAAGVVKGFGDGSFRPDIQITRQDAALMVYRAISLTHEMAMGYTFFTDDFDISDYASEAIRALGDAGIVNGDADKAFKPQNSITRAELAAIICRALDYIESH